MAVTEKPAGWISKLRLIVITSRQEDLGRSHEDVARAALDAGCEAIQLRDKEMPEDVFGEVARAVAAECERRGALFFVNDRVEVAARFACGVHLGVDDMPVKDARAVLGDAAVVGFSPESVREARRAVADGADYLGVGPVYGSGTKLDAGEAIGIRGLARMVRRGIAPVVAVGGIGPGNAAEIAQAGAAGMAVIEAVSRAGDMKEAARELLDSFERSVTA